MFKPMEPFCAPASAFSMTRYSGASIPTGTAKSFNGRNPALLKFYAKQLVIEKNAGAKALRIAQLICQVLAQKPPHLIPKLLIKYSKTDVHTCLPNHPQCEA